MNQIENDISTILQEISFLRLREADLPLMQRWLNTGFVQEWYGQGEITAAEVTAKYSPRICGEHPTHPFLILHADKPIGYIQTYRVKDYADYDACIDVDEDAAGVDLFIGETDYIHRGLGAPILRRFIEVVVWPITGCVSCVVDPEQGNTIAIRAYEKAGFSYVKIVHEPDATQPAYLMRLAKAPPDSVLAAG